MNPHFLALDAGTTSSRAIIFSDSGEIIAAASRPLAVTYPQDGWVEQAADEIWQGIRQSAEEVLQKAKLSAGQLQAVGLSNQRETTIIWERKTGRPVYPAIVWQDRRTLDYCAKWRDQGLENLVRERTGLVLDPYFSASKIRWILDHVEGVRQAAERGDLCFGTPDSWLIWHMTGRSEHLTDVTNASRTLLFDIKRQCWDEELLDAFEIPIALLPRVVASTPNKLRLDAAWLGQPLPITGIAGDQQAGLIGQGCHLPGMTKVTYGTGGFMMLNTGAEAVLSKHRLLTTIGAQIGDQTTYALEGAIFNAGTAMQWLSELGILSDIGLSAEMAAKARQGVVLVPAFTGLGAPHWAPNARGLLLGITRDTGKAEMVRAALESVMFQTRDLLECIRQDGQTPACLRVDGGMAANTWLCQSLADGLQLPVEQSVIAEGTAWGAALLAMIGVGHVSSWQATADLWQCRARFEPQITQQSADENYGRWQNAVARTLQ